MNYPDKENTLALLGDWKAHAEAVQKLMDGIQASMGLDPNGALFETVWKLFDAYTGALAVEVGDHCGWLEWYFSENGIGDDGKEAGYDGKLRPIDSLDDLCGLVFESRKRHAS